MCQTKIDFLCANMFFLFQLNLNCFKINSLISCFVLMCKWSKRNYENKRKTFFSKDEINRNKKILIMKKSQKLHKWKAWRSTRTVYRLFEHFRYHQIRFETSFESEKISQVVWKVSQTYIINQSRCNRFLQQIWKR